jgi:hypothetical protein
VENLLIWGKAGSIKDFHSCLLPQAGSLFPSLLSKEVVKVTIYFPADWLCQPDI